MNWSVKSLGSGTPQLVPRSRRFIPRARLNGQCKGHLNLNLWNVPNAKSSNYRPLKAQSDSSRALKAQPVGMADQPWKLEVYTRGAG